MVPRHRGLTRTAAVGESILYRARGVLGGAAAGRGLVAMVAIEGQDSEWLGSGGGRGPEDNMDVSVKLTEIGLV